MRYARWIVWTSVFWCLVGGCSSEDSGQFLVADAAGQQGLTREEKATEQLEEVLALQGLTLVDAVEVGGHTGYLAQFSPPQGLVSSPKYCLILTGTPYSMGYQACYLRPEAAHGMLTDFMRRVGVGQLNMLGIGIDPDSEEGYLVFDQLYPVILDFCHDVEAYIPQGLREEMQGVVDGMHSRGYLDVTYDDVLVLNQGVDSTYYFLGAMLGKTLNPDDNRKALSALVSMLQASSTLGRSVQITDGQPQFVGLGRALLPRSGCNEFVVGGQATASGETYHGRDFMFSTGGIYQDAACVMVYLPDEGLPFVTVDPPGFVGHSTGLNAEGISIGMDVTQGAAFGADEGVGCMMIARQVLHGCRTLEEAVDTVRGTHRGVPWQYIVADDTPHPTYGCGAVIACGRDAPDFDGPDTLPAWEQWLLQGAPLALFGEEFCLGVDYTARLGDEKPEQGLMVRSARWIFPAQLKDTSLTLPINDANFPAYERTHLGVYFPDQIETCPDVVVATNHYILPRMRVTQFLPVVALIYALGPLPESVWRYETMVELILENHGGIEFFGDDAQYPARGSAGWIIDFLNTQRENWWFYRGQDQDGEPVEPLDREVEGHHVVMNNTKGELRGLFGRMTDPWVGVQLAPFEAWHAGQDPS